MVSTTPINALVLQEFRLHAADSVRDAARIVATFSPGIEPAVPLLTSIDDGRDVAIVRGFHAGEETEADPMQRAALDPFVATWQPVRRYGPRIAERSESPSTYYRLAVTESGINDAAVAPPDPVPEHVPSTSKRVGLLWIGQPVGTHAGLLTLLGTDDLESGRSEPRDWLPLSRSIGVRIYESQNNQEYDFRYDANSSTPTERFRACGPRTSSDRGSGTREHDRPDAAAWWLRAAVRIDREGRQGRAR